MKHLILIVSVIILSSCIYKSENDNLVALNTKSIETNLTCKKGPLEFSIFDKPNVNKELYAVKFSTIHDTKSKHDLIIDMRLKNGGFFVSPNAVRHFSGKFTVAIEDNEAFDLLGSINESPLSVEEIDSHPYVNGAINWVKESTIYTQKIKLKTVEDFEVKGYIQFTIEPACTLEKIPFIIKKNKGELKFDLLGC